MTLQQVLDLINAEIIANGNNEITANVLRPILEAMVEQPNDLIGLLGDLNTADQTSIVNAINSIYSQNLPNATALRPIDTTGVDFNQSELLWVRDAINNTIANNGNITCQLGEQIVFYLDALISNDGTNAVIQRRYYRLTSGATVVSGLPTGLNVPLMQDGSEIRIVVLTSDIVIDLGDIGTDTIEDGFNGDSNQPFTISGDTFVQAVQDSETKLWLWIGGDGTFGNSATLAESTFFVDLTDGDVPIIGNETLQQITENGATTNILSTFSSGLNVGDGTLAIIDLDPTNPFVSYIGYAPGGMSVNTEGTLTFTSQSGAMDKTLAEILAIVDTWNATTNTPTLANTDTNKDNKIYRVATAGTVDFGAGNITFAVDDYVINDGTVWRKFINNNQSGGSGDLLAANNLSDLDDADTAISNLGITATATELNYVDGVTSNIQTQIDNISTPTDASTFTGEIDLTNRAGSYYDEYDLATDGQITFSLASSPLTFAYSYFVIDSDGVTEFATKPNLDAIFNEQYNVPSDRILSEGKHALYILKTPSGTALSIPVNEYNPDVVAPTLSNYTINDTNPDRVSFESSEEITGTTFGGFTLGSGKTVTAININSGSTTGHYFTVNTDYVNADGNDTIAYSGSGSNIQDLSGNALASFTATTVTNNIPSSLAFTLDGALTESPTNFFTKTGGTNSFVDGFAVSTTTVTGAFNFRVEMATTDQVRVMIGVSTDGTNRAYSTAPAWGYAAYGSSATQIRDYISGTLQGTYTPPVSPAAGQYLEIRRDASNNMTMWYDGTQYGTTTVVSGAVYLHFMANIIGTEINNPETY